MQAATMKKSKHIRPAKASDRDCQSHINIAAVDFSMTPKCWWSWTWRRKYYSVNNNKPEKGRRRKRRKRKKEEMLVEHTCLWWADTAAAFIQSSSSSTSSSVPQTVSECFWQGLNTIDLLESHTVHGMHSLSCSCHHWCSSQNASINWTLVNRISK